MKVPVANSRSTTDLRERTPFHTMKVCAAICVAVIVFNVMPSRITSAQSGTTTVINFDAPAFSEGQIITSTAGVTFPSSPMIFAPSNVSTFSPPYALRSTQPCEDSGCTNKAFELPMIFSQDVDEVSVHVGNDDSDESKCFIELPYPDAPFEGYICPVYARLVGYDQNGNEVTNSGDVFITDEKASSRYWAPIKTEVRIYSLAANIRSAVLFVGKTFPDGPATYPARAQIDELYYSVPGGPRPTAPSPPVIKITSPLTGQSIAFPYEITIKGNITALGGLAAFCTSLNKPSIARNDCNQRGRVQPDGSFSFLLTDISGLEPTNNTLYAFAYDSFGQVGQAQSPINLQTPPPPTIQIIQPQAGEYRDEVRYPWLEAPYWLVQISAPGGLAAFCTRANESTIPPQDECTQTNDVSKYGTFMSQIEPSLLKLADNNFYAFAYDRWGQTATASVSFRMPTDLRITAMEITQGIQSEQIQLNTNGVARYSGATLVKGGKTIVRVFANAAAGGPYSVPATLCGIGLDVLVEGRPYNNVKLCINSDNKGVNLLAGGTEPTLGERLDPNSAYVFTLPFWWTFGSDDAISLTAEIGHSTAQIGFFTNECAQCLGNNTFTVTDINFVRRDSITISPVEIIWTDSNGAEVRPSDPSVVFARTAAISPLPELGLDVRPYAGQIDVTNFLTDNSATPGKGRCDNTCTNKIFEKVAEFEKNNLPGYTIGVSQGLNTGLEAPVTYARFPTILAWEPIAIVDQGPRPLTTATPEFDPRPLTIVTHEFYHQLAYYHAGMSCPTGWPTTSWPPDDRGLIQGIGLDRRPGTGPLPGTYRIIGPGTYAQPYYAKSGDTLRSIASRFRTTVNALRKVNPQITDPNLISAGQAITIPLEYVDLMSYCIDQDQTHWLPDNGDYNAWISLRNWNAFGGPWPNGLVPSDELPPPEEGQVGAFAATLKSTNEQTFRLVATTNGIDQVRILSVQQGTGNWTTNYEESPYQVIVRDQADAEISRSYLAPLAGHIHGNDDANLFTVLSGEVPADGATQLEITYKGEIVATRSRSANKPEVMILIPQANDHISGTGDVLLRWDARDTDGDQLEAIVEYSADNGQTYRVLTTGVQGSEVSLPARLFTGSKQARIRVTVNDGFNDSVAVSDTFSVEGFPPQVRVIEPIDNLKIYSDVGLRLVGQAFDDSNQQVADEQMHWFAGEDEIGTGSIIDGPKLPPGMYKVRLEATDAQGRIGSMTVNVEVLAVPPVPTAPIQVNWLWIGIMVVLIITIAVLSIVRRRRTPG